MCISLLRDRFLVQTPQFGRFVFGAAASINDRMIDLKGWQAAPNGFVTRSPEGEWRLTWQEIGQGVRVSLHATLKRSAARAQLIPIKASRVRIDHLLTHGRSMGKCRLLPVDQTHSGCFPSHFLTALTWNGVTLQLAHPLSQEDTSRFAIQLSRGTARVEAITDFEHNRKRKLTSAPVTISLSSNGHDLMTEWADAQISTAERLPVPQECGWNSWDYYRWTITEDEVLRNAEFIAADPVLAKHIRRIIIDDGWQYCYGEWEPNRHFPSGMDKLARNLKRMGFVPGLWFAPTIVEPHSHLAQLGSECMTHGAAGIPCLGFSCMERKGFILDPTHPKVAVWWEEIFRRYAGYGFRYFKLDFLSATVPNRIFWDRQVKSGQLMQRIIGPIRRAVGPASRILGCNFTFEEARGLVDDVRISADVHAQWSSVKENVSSIATRFWAHRRFWINDPDFTLCRGEETANDPDLHRLKPLLPYVRPDDTNSVGIDYLNSLVDLNRNEAEVLMSLVIISGGAMNLSDSLPRLNENGLRLLRKAVQAKKGDAGIALDLFKSEYPGIWVQKIDAETHRLLLINWKDEPQELAIDLGRWNIPRGRANNFWTGESVSLRSARLAPVLAPHSCLLVETQA